MTDEPRKTEFVEAFYRGRRDAPATPVIDDRTWGDLDMDEVFHAIDRTRSSVGQACLYDMLRRPLFDATEIEERARRTHALAADGAARGRLSRVLTRLGVQRDGEAFRFLVSHSASISDKRRFIFIALSILVFVGIALVVGFGLNGLILLAPVVITNFIIHYKHKTVVVVESPSYQYLHRLMAAADRLPRLRIAHVSARAEALGELSKSFRRLRRRTALLMSPTGLSGDIVSVLIEYIRACFLQEVITHYLAHNEIVARRAELIRMYGLVGEIDAFLSVATLRAERPTLCTPQIVPGRQFEGEGMVHPLLEKPVANSLTMAGRGVVVTGSNMSGKSTFLRTIGVNQILATTLGLAFARRMRITAMLTVSSITNRDNILASESHYLVEAKRLLDILAAARDMRPALVIIDEILSGTNSEERIAASISILRHLAGLNCLVVAATHDRAIAADLGGIYGTAHFTHKVEEEGLQFDYTLREGIVEAGNAIKLLRLLGYPQEIMGGLMES